MRDSKINSEHSLQTPNFSHHKSVPQSVPQKNERKADNQLASVRMPNFTQRTSFLQKVQRKQRVTAMAKEIESEQLDSYDDHGKLKVGPAGNSNTHRLSQRSRSRQLSFTMNAKVGRAERESR